MIGDPPQQQRSRCWLVLIDSASAGKARDAARVLTQSATLFSFSKKFLPLTPTDFFKFFFFLYNININFFKNKTNYFQMEVFFNYYTIF